MNKRDITNFMSDSGCSSPVDPVVPSPPNLAVRNIAKGDVVVQLLTVTIGADPAMEV